MAKEVIFDRDLVVMRAMVDHIEPYLASDATRWDMGTAGMPPMTIGGILMRRARLALVDDDLSAEQHRLRDEANQLFDAALIEKIVRFEKRAEAELHARMREWTNYLRDLPSKSAAQPAIYAHVADTRVIVEALRDKLHEPPYKLDPRISHNVAAVDTHLKSLWIKGPFIWDGVWEIAYPLERYWYLYGGPRAV